MCYGQQGGKQMLMLGSEKEAAHLEPAAIWQTSPTQAAQVSPPITNGDVKPTPAPGIPVPAPRPLAYDASTSRALAEADPQIQGMKASSHRPALPMRKGS